MIIVLSKNPSDYVRRHCLNRQRTKELSSDYEPNTIIKFIKDQIKSGQKPLDIFVEEDFEKRRSLAIVVPWMKSEGIEFKMLKEKPRLEYPFWDAITIGIERASEAHPRATQRLDGVEENPRYIVWPPTQYSNIEPSGFGDQISAAPPNTTSIDNPYWQVARNQAENSIYVQENIIRHEREYAAELERMNRLLNARDRRETGNAAIYLPSSVSNNITSIFDEL
jgi:hypothetical protein